MRRSPHSLVGLALLLIAGCAGGAAPATDTSTDEAAIRSLDAEWNAYIVAQNDSAIASTIYASNAILMPPNMPRMTGAAIRTFWAGLWPLKATLVITPLTVQVSGAWAIEEGSYAFSVPTPAGDQKDVGKYLVSWHKAGGKWQAVQDIWSSDNPPPPPAPAATAKP